MINNNFPFPLKYVLLVSSLPEKKRDAPNVTPYHFIVESFKVFNF